VSCGAVRGFLMSWLRKQAEGLSRDAFVQGRPEDWLVWEAGPWRPTYRNRSTISAAADPSQPPHGIGESLAIALEPTAGKPYLSLGRAPDNDLVLDDATLSRLHLLLTKEPAGWTVRDAGSTNGTTVNGARLGPEPILLAPGTDLVAGSVRLTFHDSASLYLRLKAGR
jgi:hypothetical protein